MDKIFRALADKNRRKIVTILRKSELSVNQMLDFLEIGQATLSSHLAVLRKSKLVEYKVNGRQRIYRLNVKEMNNFVSKLNQFVGWEELGLVEKEIVTRK